MSTQLIEQLVAAGRLDEATAFLRQLCLAVPSPLIDPFRRELVQQAFRLAEIRRGRRLGAMGSVDADTALAQIAQALAEIAAEIESAVGAEATACHAAAFAALADPMELPAVEAREVTMAADSSPAAHDVFISYCHCDLAVAEALARTLAGRSVAVWMDQRLVAGERYADRINAALDAARAVLVLWSPDSVRSDWVRYEARRAHAQGKHVPLLAAGLGVDDLPPPYPAVLHAVASDDHAGVLACLERLEVAC